MEITKPVTSVLLRPKFSLIAADSKADLIQANGWNLAVSEGANPRTIFVPIGIVGLVAQIEDCLSCQFRFRVETRMEISNPFDVL